MYIYIDILVMINIYIGFFLIKGTARLINSPVSKPRLFFSSGLSGLYSLLILFDISGGRLVAIKLAMGLSLVLIAFPIKNRVEFIKTLFCFFGVNFIYGGMMAAIWLFASPMGMVYRNGVAYFNVSALFLVIATIAAYLMITIAVTLLERRGSKKSRAEIQLCYHGNETAFSALIDTGNKLCDVFSGLPVIVCEYSVVSGFFPSEFEAYFKDPSEYLYKDESELSFLKSFRLVPLTAAAGESVLAAFKPDKIIIDSKPRNAMIAISASSLSNGDYQAVVSPSLL